MINIYKKNILKILLSCQNYLSFAPSSLCGRSSLLMRYYYALFAIIALSIILKWRFFCEPLMGANTRKSGDDIGVHSRLLAVKDVSRGER